MRTIFRPSLALSALAFGGALALAGGAVAQQAVSPEGVIFLPDGSSFYNQNSLNLPSMTMPYGQDEVQGAGGVSCRSSVASGGPYVDFGMIGSNDLYDRQAASVYGRVVVPLGKRPERLDCERLYQLEIERLQMELEMARMGLGMMMPPDAMPAMAQIPQPEPAVTSASAPAIGVAQQGAPRGALATALAGHAPAPHEMFGDEYEAVADPNLPPDMQPAVRPVDTAALQ